VQTLRRLVLRHRHWAALLLALALLARALLPAGYMPVMAGKTLTVAMCQGDGPVTIVIPVSGKAGGESGDGVHHAPCAFSALNGAALAAADPLLLAQALLFAFVFALYALPLPPLRRGRHLRPPLRGPPAHA